MGIGSDWWASCVGKAQFASKAHALSAVKHWKGGFNVYKCRFCGKYHVGHDDKKGKRK